MLKWLLTGGLIPPLLLLVGLFFLIYLRGYPWRAPRKMLSAFTPEKKGEGTSSFSAMMLALAGTLGVGNIVGVANAIAIGGAGAVFWMWISALFAMILKYAEILLAVSHRRTDAQGHHFGGAVYYIRDCFLARKRERLALVIPAVFAMLFVINALSILDAFGAAPLYDTPNGVKGEGIGSVVSLTSPFSSDSASDLSVRC